MGEETDIGTVFIINKFKVKNGNQPFRCIMIYQDKETEFCFIRPLLYKIDLEIVMELFKIFTSFGPPKVVYMNSCTQETITSIDSNIKMLSPFKIEFVKSNTVNTKHMLVVTKLLEWMKKTNREQWEIGCCVVQLQINTALASGKEKSPHELFFRQQENNNESDLNSSDSEIEQTIEEAETLEENEPLEQEETLEQDENLEQDETLEQQETLEQDEILEQESINIPLTYEQVPAAVLSDHTLENTNDIKIKEELIETDDIETLGENLGSYVHLFDDGISIRNLGKIIDIGIKEETDDTD